NEPGRTEWEGFATATAAAAAGGVTPVVDMPLNSVPPTVDPAALEVKREAAAGQVHVDVGFWGGAIPGNTGRLRALHAAGVVGVKCFLLDSGVPEFPPLDPAQLRAALTELSTVDGLLIAHCEDAAAIGPARARLPGFPRLPAAAGRDQGGGRPDRGGQGDRRPGARRARLGGRGAAAAARRRRRRRSDHRRDLPAL